MKKFIIRLLWGTGIGLCLIFVVSSILVLRGKLNIPKVQASPGPACEVNDVLKVYGTGGSQTLIVKGTGATYNTYLDIIANPADTGTDSWAAQLRFLKSPGNVPSDILHIIRGGSPNAPLTITPGFNGQAPNVLKVDGNLDIGCQWVWGGCTGTTKVCSSNAKSCTCDSSADKASVTCPDGTVLISGGCGNKLGTGRISEDYPISATTWYCDWSDGPNNEYAFALCCRINTTYSSP